MTCVGLYFSKSLRVCAGSLVYINTCCDRYRCSYKPQVSFGRTGEYPSFVFLLAKARTGGFILDNILDGLANETRTSSDKNDRRHDWLGEGELGVWRKSKVEPRACIALSQLPFSDSSDRIFCVSLAFKAPRVV